MATIDFLSLYPKRLARIRHLGLLSFWWSLFYACLVIRLFFTEPSLTLAFVAGLVFLNAIVNSCLLKIRRLHDCNFSAWWLLLLFIPLFGTLWFFAIFIMSGSVGQNQFGNVPPEPTTFDYLLILSTPLMMVIYFILLLYV